MSHAHRAIDWAAICAKIPSSAAEKSQRMAMFKQFDPNGNGYLSLAEVDKGLRDVLNLPDVFDAKPVIIRAFTAAKNVGAKFGKGQEQGSDGADYVEKKEFRMLLVYLACYLRIYEVFLKADQSGDQRLSKDEFMSVVPKLQQWLGEGGSNSGEAWWAKFNSDGGNYVLFTEFADGAIQGVLLNDNPEAE